MGENEKGPAGITSSCSSMGLPDICWPFQPCHPASHHHPPPPPRTSPLSILGFISLRSPPFFTQRKSEERTQQLGVTGR